MYKLITSSEGSDDLSTGFDRNSGWRRDEMTNNRKRKRWISSRNYAQWRLWFCEHQKKATYKLAYKLTLTRNKDEAVIDKVAGIADARNKIDHIHWYAPHYTPSIQQQSIISKQISSKTHTELK